MTLPVVFTANGAQGYNLTKSLRFRSSASAYLSKTWGANGSSQTFTISAWVKRGALGSTQAIVTARQNGLNNVGFRFTSADVLELYAFSGGSLVTNLITTQAFRDPSAWYHIVCSVDTTQATSTNRVKFYVNGTQITAFSTATYPSLNATTLWNQTAATHYFATYDTSSELFDGYMAEINVIDGQALTPSSFGQTNSATGVWQPAKYTGTYGTNGFYLPFTNTTSTSTLGNDFSGNSNTWTVNNISLTSGSTYDSMTDVPTNTNSNTANYCTLNPLEKSNGAYTFSNANLNVSGSGGVSLGAGSTMSVSSGKWYWEQTITAIAASDSANAGIRNIAGNPEASGSFNGGVSGSYIYRSDGVKRNNASSSSYGASFTTNDVIGVALDLDAGTLVFYKNGSSQGTAYSSLSGTFEPIVSGDQSSGTTSYAVNFGQRPFAYTPPTGFVALNTYNLPTPTIGATASTQANKYMDATLYTGTGASLSVTNAGSFQPDMVWIKSRSAATDNKLTDAVRGTTKGLISNTTGAETTDTNGLTAFNSNGFTVGTDTVYNNNTATYVAWQWKANGSGSTNTAGSITSTVSANTTAGFSIVTYTGTGANATVGHGLGVTPSMIITKSRNATNDWGVYHVGNTVYGNSSFLRLNTTNASINSSSAWNNTAPTSSVFSVGTLVDTNTAGAMVAYCFAQVAGYSAFGSYTGNGSSDGPFVFTGFRPRYVLIKDTTNTNDWFVMDTARGTYNTIVNYLNPNKSLAEQTDLVGFDILSNGFKVRQAGALNNNNANLIYMAFAENPFKYSLAR